MVLSQIVPGLEVGFKVNKKYHDKNDCEIVSFDFIAKRDGLEYPLSYESDGVRKIISILAMYTTAFNQQSTTVAIDELDAGIFEFILGELIEIFQDYGKGQLIFTSHNLRPLEVVNKNNLYFTTNNPDKRYIQLKGIRENNNLRDTYFREILLGGQEEELYRETKKYKIVAALKNADEEKEWQENDK